MPATPPPHPLDIARKRVSMVVPTFQEAGNLPGLIRRVAEVAQAQGWEPELLIMDDDSRDGSDQAVAGAGVPWAHLITRTTDRGLSPAVLDGLRRATGDYLVVLDADLSHPPEQIPELIAALDGGADFALGSRYVEGGSTDHDWGLFRWLNSRIATLLARPLTHVKDPMSGFFAIKRTTFEAGRQFSPIGYKIGLELLVKCGCKKPLEIPIHFTDRQVGQSKLTLREQLKYIKHVRRLLIYRYGKGTALTQFFVVGTIGAIINLAVLTFALRLGLRASIAVALGIGVSFVTNFLLSRRFAFTYVRDRSWGRDFATFATASLAGAILNYAVTMALYRPTGPIGSPQLAAVIGIIAGALLNFLFNRYFAFRSRHYKPKGAKP
jgi:dolichol-phosphate mannosyltransferase